MHVEWVINQKDLWPVMETLDHESAMKFNIETISRKIL